VAAIANSTLTTVTAPILLSRKCAGRLVAFVKKSPLTEDTLSGVTGAHVASDAVEELNNVLVPAQIPDRKTEEEAAASWDPKQKQEFVTSVGVKLAVT